MTPSARPWQKLVLIATGLATGLSVVAIAANGTLLWYLNRPAAWDSSAITATFQGLSATSDRPQAFVFAYTVENHTTRNYQLPGANTLFMVLAQSEGLQQDATLKWHGATSIPAGQRINTGVELARGEYTAGADCEKLIAFLKDRLSGVAGFAALDQSSKFDIRFPKPPDVRIALDLASGATPRRVRNSRLN